MEKQSFAIIIKVTDEGIELSTEINASVEFTAFGAEQALAFIQAATKSNVVDVITGEFGLAVASALNDLRKEAEKDQEDINDFLNNKN